ncbi:hypothetical protein FQA39_LY11325 [Lamprigera yunnana]|nr:hypothetical protein FQA39_LY11325 [Lamprigera yunnana]
MEVHVDESCLIKSEVVVGETFAVCGKYEDCGNEELKVEPIGYEELFKCKEEEGSLEHLDICTATLQQCTCSKCNFESTKNGFLIKNLTTSKKTPLKSSLQEHLRDHNIPCDIYKESNLNIACIVPSISQLKTAESGEDNSCKACNYPSVCNNCEYKTVRKYDSKTNTKIHMGEVYNCQECEYKTIRKCNLKAHMQKHRGDKYECKECGYKTERKNNFKTHMKIHSGEKYECKKCDYKTVREHDLKNHIKIHMGDEYKCNECEYKTVRKYDLKTHMKLHMDDEYKCQECEYKTVWKYNLKAHMQEHMGDKYECNECGYKTVWTNNLKII